MKDEIFVEYSKLNKEFEELKKRFDDLEPLYKHFDFEICKFVFDLKTWIEKYR